MLYRIVLLAGFCCTANGQAECEVDHIQTETPELQQLYDRLEQMEINQRRLEARLETLVTQLIDNANALPTVQPAAANAPDNDDLPALPAEPTASQVDDYIDRVLQTARGNTSFSSRDPQIDALTLLDPEHVNALLNALPRYRHGGDFYLLEALKQLVDDQHKTLILAALEESPNLIDIVIARRWQTDPMVREILVDGLRQRVNDPMAFLPPDWVAAVASFQDPTTYADLRQQLINGMNKRWTYQALKTLPDFDLDEAVEAMWLSVNNGWQTWNKLDAATIAAGYGHKDALDTIIDALAEPQEHRHAIARYKEIVRQLTDARGTIDAMVEWYNEHGPWLTFDPVHQRYE